jgi:protease I
MLQQLQLSMATECQSDLGLLNAVIGCKISIHFPDHGKGQIMSAQKSVAILVHEGYQDLEFWYPLLRLREEGVPVTVVGVDADKTYLSKLEYPVIPDIGIGQAQAKDFAAVIVPGGASAERISREPRMVRFIADAAAAGALVAATAEGVAVLAPADVRGKRVGRDGDPVIRDGRLITARSTDNLPAFCRALFEALAAAAPAKSPSM